MNYSKDGVTVAAMFDTAHPKKSGKCPVKIRVTYNRVRNYYPTGKDLSPEEWEILPTTKVRALVAIRKDIESSYQIVRAAVEELAGAGGFSLDALNNRLKGAASDTVNTMFRAKIGEGRTYRKYVDIRQCIEGVGAVCRDADSVRCYHGGVVGKVCRFHA